MKQRGWMIRAGRRPKGSCWWFITVGAEIGEPIHKLATGGARLW